MSIRDIPNSVALPQSAQMKLKPNAVPAVRKRINIQPYTKPSGAITSSQLIQFYVPARRNTMYDPQTMYLRGRISASNPDNTATILNRNAFSLINRLQVYGQDSTLLEDIQNYNQLCHTVMDIQMSREDKYALSTMYGGNDSVGTFTGQIAATDAVVTNRNAAGALINVGAIDNTVQATVGRLGATNAGAGAAVAVSLNTSALNNVIDNGVSRVKETPDDKGLRFCIPIVSAFGLLADTMIPVGWLNADLRFDFYTENPQVAFRCTTPAAVTSYTLEDLELVLDTVEFDPASMALVNQFAPVNGPLFCHASTYKNYSASIPAQAGFYSQLVPHRSLSVKQLLATAYRTSLYNAATGYDSFHRVLPYGSENLGIQLSIGGLKFPQKAITSYAEAFAELQKSQHAFNQLILNGSINRTEYYKFNGNIAAVGDELSCKPVLGFDLEIYDKKGSTIINGSNWTGLNVFIEGTLANVGNAGTALADALTGQYFVSYDVIYVIQDGQISVRF